ERRRRRCGTSARSRDAAARHHPVTLRAGAPWRVDVVAKRCRCAASLRAWLLATRHGAPAHSALVGEIGANMRLTPELLLNAYAVGIFPMAESREQRELYWIDPDRRGVLPLDSFHLPKRLRRTLKSHPFAIRIDQQFAQVVDGCAEPGPGRPDTWIN